MADVLYEFREAGLLPYIRRVKVLHTAGLARSELKRLRVLGNITAYNILQKHQDLCLAHLEYEIQTSLFKSLHPLPSS